MPERSADSIYLEAIYQLTQAEEEEEDQNNQDYHQVQHRHQVVILPLHLADGINSTSA